MDKKFKFDEDLKKAKEKFPNNKTLAIMAQVLKQSLNADSNTGDDELSPEIVVSLEVVDQEMNITDQEILTDQQKNDESYVPSFSLGRDEIEKECNQDLVTPEPQGEKSASEQ